MEAESRHSIGDRGPAEFQVLSWMGPIEEGQVQDSCDSGKAARVLYHRRRSDGRQLGSSRSSSHQTSSSWNNPSLISFTFCQSQLTDRVFVQSQIQMRPEQQCLASAETVLQVQMVSRPCSSSAVGTLWGQMWSPQSRNSSWVPLCLVVSQPRRSFSCREKPTQRLKQSIGRSAFAM